MSKSWNLIRIEFATSLKEMLLFSLVFSAMISAASCVTTRNRDPEAPTNERKVSEESSLQQNSGPRKRIDSTTVRVNTTGAHVADLEKKVTDYWQKMFFKGDKYVQDSGANAHFRLDVEVTSFEGRPDEGEERGVKYQQGLFELKIHAKLTSVRSQKALYDTTKIFTHKLPATRLKEVWTFNDLVQNRFEFAEEMIKDGIVDFITPLQQALAKTQWEGRISSIKENRYYLNVGEASGLKLGDILKVYTESQEVYDNSTGNLIGSDPGVAKGTLEIVEFMGADSSVARVHSGGAFKENDRLQLFY